MKNSCFIVLLFLLVLSCRSVKEIKVDQRVLENISERKLFRNIDLNKLNYNTLYSKKMSVTLITDKKSNSFKATMRIQRDSFIWVSLTAPLGIEVARLLLTPDSIKFINSHNKEYFLSDYSYFEEKFDISLSFSCIQQIFTNQFFNFETCTSSEHKVKRYKFDKSGNNYLLYTLEEKALGRKLKRLYKMRQKNKEYSLILQKIEVDPVHFRPCTVSIEDVEEQMGMSVRYKEFNDFQNHLFPEEMVFKIFAENGRMELGIVFNRLEFDVEVEPNFKISNKYKRIY